MVVKEVREVGCGQSTLPALQGFGDCKTVGPVRGFFPGPEPDLHRYFRTSSISQEAGCRIHTREGRSGGTTPLRRTNLWAPQDPEVPKTCH